MTTLPGKLARRLRSEMDARNADNVSRTASYLELYGLSRETEADWPWLLMAHLVSRNAGYLMVDVAQAIDHPRRVFAREALLESFAMLERANFLIFDDAWHHVLCALERSGGGFDDDPKTTLHMKRAYASYFSDDARRFGSAERERRLVLELVTNEQHFIEHRVVHAAAFTRAMALVEFVEKGGHERPMVLPCTAAEITVGGFADVERRIDTGRRIFDEVLADGGRRAEIFAWALETPHTGSRAAYGGKPGPSLRDVWPIARVESLAEKVHAPAEPDPRWP